MDWPKRYISAAASIAEKQQRRSGPLSTSLRPQLHEFS
jgi:hypothetical protein